MSEVEKYLNDNLSGIKNFEIGKSYVVINMNNGDVVHIDKYTNDIEKDVVLKRV